MNILLCILNWFPVGIGHRVRVARLLFPCLCFWIVPRVWSERTNHPNLSLPCSNIIQDREQSWKMILFTSSPSGVWDGLFSQSLWSVLGLSDECSGIPERMKLSHGLLLWMSMCEFRARAELNPLSLCLLTRKFSSFIDKTHDQLWFSRNCLCLESISSFDWGVLRLVWGHLAMLTVGKVNVCITEWLVIFSGTCE